ncbi:hypothetical protein BB560_005835 [Smittium megazygosporum]|uniref:60S acidic ribosomal protein P1 n=1 Tax=Smittium megazygosporum TaxID=133381 RepID=A0A2T9YUK4_9FUNG|nr:hypothetical protein BB560_005835 [Smittium megazygosporum]
MSVAEKAIIYASLILADDGLEINADNLQTLTKAAGVSVDPVYFSIFAKALGGRDINDMIMNAGTAPSPQKFILIGNIFVALLLSSQIN